MVSTGVINKIVLSFEKYLRFKMLPFKVSQGIYEMLWCSGGMRRVRKVLIWVIKSERGVEFSYCFARWTSRLVGNKFLRYEKKALKHDASLAFIQFGSCFLHRKYAPSYMKTWQGQDVNSLVKWWMWNRHMAQITSEWEAHIWQEVGSGCFMKLKWFQYCSLWLFWGNKNAHKWQGTTENTRGDEWEMECEMHHLTEPAVSK